MKLPPKPVCTEKDMRSDGTSIIFIQYCYSSEKRTNLNTKIAIPPKYWDKKELTISHNLPSCHGPYGELKKVLKQKLRLAEDLVEIANKVNVQNKGQFVKAAFDAELDPESLEKDAGKVKELAGEKETSNLDVYFQIDEYVKAKSGKVSDSTITVFENMKSHLKAFENFRNEPITFDCFDFNFYDAYVDFLTFDYVQPRFKKPVSYLTSSVT